MSRIPLTDRVATGPERQLSRGLVAAGRRLRRLNARRGHAPGARLLRRTEYALMRSGKRVGARSRDQMKAAKRRADAAGEPARRKDAVSAAPAKVADLHALVAERHAADTELARRELARLAAGEDPVIVGPFVDDVGLELLYWVPFVRWALREFPELRDRLILGTRGGTRAWYGEGFREHVDVLDVFSDEEFAERRPDSKQREPTPLDHEFLSAVTERFGIREPKLLHPGLMWSGYQSGIKADELCYARAVQGAGPGGNEPLSGLRSLYTPIAPPSLGDLRQALPADFVAARFHFSPTFPDTPENRAFATALLTALSERIPVVLLNNGLTLDGHTDLDLDETGIITLEDRMAPATTLQVQTAVVGHARAFVGTFGGLAYLPPHLGTPSLAFSEGGPLPSQWHLELAQQIFQGSPWGSLAVLTKRDLDILELLMGTQLVPATP